MEPALQAPDPRDDTPESREAAAAAALRGGGGGWRPEYGGETVFLDDEGDIALSVLPKPGRLVIFDSRLMHLGRPPSALLAGCGYSTAVQIAQSP